MKKISLFLIALLTVGCSDLNDKYIALECSTIKDIPASFELIMDDNSKTFSFYVDNVALLGETSKDPGFFGLFNGTYLNDGEHYYLLTITEVMVIKDKFSESGETEIKDLRDQNLQHRIDRRTLKYTDELGNIFQCREIDVPDYYLVDEANKNLI